MSDIISHQALYVRLSTLNSALQEQLSLALSTHYTYTSNITMSGVQSPAQSPAQQSGSEPNGGYPEQRHAGAVGYGPEYGKGAVNYHCTKYMHAMLTVMHGQSTGDKLTGMKEEVKGKIFHKPELVEHGHELRTGALKQKQMQEDVSHVSTISSVMLLIYFYP